MENEPELTEVGWAKAVSSNNNKSPPVLLYAYACCSPVSHSAAFGCLPDAIMISAVLKPYISSSDLHPIPQGIRCPATVTVYCVCSHLPWAQQMKQRLCVLPSYCRCQLHRVWCCTPFQAFRRICAPPLGPGRGLQKRGVWAHLLDPSGLTTGAASV